jgi:hypothetical protein
LKLENKPNSTFIFSKEIIDSVEKFFSFGALGKKKSVKAQMTVLEKLFGLLLLKSFFKAIEMNIFRD